MDHRTAVRLRRWHAPLPPDPAAIPDRDAYIAAHCPQQTEEATR